MQELRFLPVAFLSIVANDLALPEFWVAHSPILLLTIFAHELCLALIR